MIEIIVTFFSGVVAIIAVLVFVNAFED